MSLVGLPSLFPREKRDLFWIWNYFMQALIAMGPDEGQLAFVRLWRFLNDQQVGTGTIFAGVVVLSMPVTILYLAMQRRFVKGLTAGAME